MPGWICVCLCVCEFAQTCVLGLCACQASALPLGFFLNWDFFCFLSISVFLKVFPSLCFSLSCSLGSLHCRSTELVSLGCGCSSNNRLTEKIGNISFTEVFFYLREKGLIGVHSLVQSLMVGTVWQWSGSQLWWLEYEAAWSNLEVRGMLILSESPAHPHPLVLCKTSACVATIVSLTMRMGLPTSVKPFWKCPLWSLFW